MAVYTQLCATELQEIADHYSLKIVDFEPVSNGAANSNYVLHTQQGRCMLTIFHEKTFDEVIEQGQLLLFLTARGFSTSRLLPNTGGQIATMYKGQPVLVKAYITGQVSLTLSNSMLRQLGLAMGRLHQLPVPDFLPDKQTYGRRKLSDIRGKNVDSAYESWVSGRLFDLEQQMPRGLPQGLIHGDIFYDNVLFAGEKLQAIIDFEEASCGAKVFDLGMAIVGVCGTGSAIEFKQAQALAQGYEQIRLLEEPEKAALQFFVEYAATTVSCWRYWKYHIDTPSVEKAEKHLHMARVADATRNTPPAQFLDAVFGYLLNNPG